MRIHADFSQIAIIKPEDYHWVKSPRGEVERVMLDRIGTEQARATSLVNYAANSVFPAHQHHLGEEVLVLAGVFSENHERHYPEGWYLRNPHNSVHQASSKNGALILVKLMQMTEQEHEETRINTHDPANWVASGNKMRCPLYRSEFETTYLEKLGSHQWFTNLSDQGIELFVITGQLRQDAEIFPAGSWIRLPPQWPANFQAGESGVTLYVKEGHLIYAQNVWK